MHDFEGYVGDYTDLSPPKSSHLATSQLTALLVVCPVLSRVCQIFYEIKGGRVNYGQAHARKYGHEALGKEYSGLYPEVGGTTQSLGGAVYKSVLLIQGSVAGHGLRRS
jgi:triacylglycerol lipase